MRKKMTVGMVLAIVVLVALAGVALAASLNLFVFFGEHDTRIAEIASNAMLTTDSPEVVESAKLGTTVASINSVYYDGQSLLVSYSIENGNRIERFEPTEEQLALMTRLDNRIMLPFEPSSEEQQLILNGFNEAQEDGTPYGIVYYSVYPSDHTETDDGVDLPPATEMQESVPEGGQYMLREYENPLPEEAQNRERMNIRIRLYQSIDYYYFDGKDCYMLPFEREEAGAMAATVTRTDEQTRHFTGEGTYNGVKVRVEADASAVHATVTVIAEADMFIALDEDSWYALDVRDSQGNALRTTQCGADDLRTFHTSLDGTGILPDSLTVSILIESEGEGNPISLTAPILLTMDK